MLNYQTKQVYAAHKNLYWKRGPAVEITHVLYFNEVALADLLIKDKNCLDKGNHSMLRSFRYLTTNEVTAYYSPQAAENKIF